MKRWSRRLTRGVVKSRDEAGETLVEVLLALIILSLSTVALLTAFETSINASVVHRKLANFDTVLASSISTATTVLQQQYSGVFTSCQPLSGYPSSTDLTRALNLSGFTAAIGPTGSQPAVEWSNNGTYSTTCTNGPLGDVSNPQLINVVVTDTATGVTQNNTVVVDNPAVIQTVGAVGQTADELVFVTQPGGATLSSPFTTQPILEVEDNGVLVTSDLSSITMTIAAGTGPNGASLSSNCRGIETAGVVKYSGCSINLVGTGYQLLASEADPSNSGLDLTATSDPFSVYATQLDTPTITSVVPSTVSAGAVNVTFTAAPNAPVGQAYSVKACTDSAMSVNCVVQTNFASGSDVTGLTPGSSYYVQITAAPSQNYLGSKSPPRGPAFATVQLTAPGSPALDFGTTAGSLTVSFSGSSNAPSGQTYTVKACTNTSMSTGCVTSANFTSGSSITGLGFTPGDPGGTYYVQVSASASSGYLASPPSTQANYAVLSQVETPTGPTVNSGAQSGTISAVFTEPNGGTGPASFTATVCTDSAMTQNCQTLTNYTSGTPITGLSAGTTYFVTITAVSTNPGFLSATTPAASAVATVQLAAPTGVSVDYGTVAGSVSITFTGSAGAPAGQTYTAKACTNAGMTAGCQTNANYVAGTDFTGLNFTPGNAGVTYYVQLTANASPGYIGSAASPQASHADTSQLAVPGNVNAAAGTNRGSLVVTFNAPTGTAPTSYTVQVCTNNGMTNGCVKVQNYHSGDQITGLTSRQTYWYQVTDIGPAGYANNATTVPGNGVAAR